MLRRDLAGGALVDTDRGHVERVDRAVDENDPRPLVRQLQVVAVLAAQVRHLAADEDHPLDPAVEQHVHVVDLAERCLAGVAEDRSEAVGSGSRLDRLCEGREDRVGQLRDEDADEPGFRPTAERDVEQLAHRPFDALAGSRGDRKAAIGDARGRRDTDPGPPGYFAEARYVPIVCNKFQPRMQDICAASRS